MVFEVLVETLQPVQGKGVPVHFQDEREYLQLILLYYSPDRHLIDIAGVPILESQGFTQFVQFGALRKSQVFPVYFHHSVKSRKHDIHRRIYGCGGGQLAVQHPGEGLEHRDNAVDGREELDDFLGGNIREHKVKA